MKFLEWLLLSEASQIENWARQTLQDNFEKVKAVCPEPKFLPLFVHFYHDQPNLSLLASEVNLYRELLNLKKIKMFTFTNDGIQIENRPYNYTQWKNAINAIKDEKEHSEQKDQETIPDDKPIFSNAKVTIFESNSPQKCIKHGMQHNFCIGVPGNTRWQSYRDTQTSTFYFVFDKTRNDDLAVVVLDCNDYGIEITDKKNMTNSIIQDPFSSERKSIKVDNNTIRLYFDYLRKLGVPDNKLNAIQQIAKTPQENAENAKLGQRNEFTDWFTSLSRAEKSKYIGRGHVLTDEQFDFIWNHKLTSLIEQYASIGQLLNVYQRTKILSKQPYRSTYLKFRIIASKHVSDFKKDEYDILNDKQKELLVKTCNSDCLEKIYSFADNKELIIDLALKERNNLSGLGWLLHSHFKDSDAIVNKLSQDQIDSLNGDDIEKFLYNARDPVSLAKKFGDLGLNKLSSDQIVELLIHSDKFESMLTALGPDCLDKIDDQSLDSILDMMDNEDLIQLFVKNKKDLSADEIRILLQHSRNKFETARKIIDKKQQLNVREIRHVLLFTNNAKIVNYLDKNGLEELLSDGNTFSIVLQSSKNRAELADAFLTFNLFNWNLSNQSVHALIYYASDKIVMAQKLGHHNLNKLNEYEVAEILRGSENTEAMAKVLGPDNIMKIKNLKNWSDKYETLLAASKEAA